MSSKAVVILSEDHGTFARGEEFVVVKRNKTTTVVNSKAGRRLILPNKKLEMSSEGPEEKKLETVTVTLNDFNYILKPLGKGISVQSIVDDYALEFGMNEPAAFKAVDNIIQSTKGKRVRVDEVVPAGGMSVAELEVLEKILDGDLAAWRDPSLGIIEEEVPPEEEPTLSENQVWFTDITGGRLPKSGLNHIISRYPSDHFEEEHRMYIPEVDPDHYWDTEALEALVIAYKLRERGLLTGLPGTGKTTSVAQFAAWIRQPYLRLGGRGDLESASFLGSGWTEIETLPDGSHVPKMVFKPGMLTQGLIDGYLVTIDEVMKIPAYIQMCMQHLYEKGGYLTIDDLPGTKADKIFHPHEEFFLILTDNVKGTGDSFDKFAATQVQDGSTLDRVNINAVLNYLPEAEENAMLSRKFPKGENIKKLVKFANLVRNGYKQGSIALTLSPRGLIAILEMTTDLKVPLRTAIELAFVNKIADETEVLAIKEMLKTVGIKMGE